MHALHAGREVCVSLDVHALGHLLHRRRGQGAELQLPLACALVHEGLEAGKPATQLVGKRQVLAVAKGDEAAAGQRLQEPLHGDHPALADPRLARQGKPVAAPAPGHGQGHALHAQGAGKAHGTAPGPLHVRGQIRGLELFQQLQHLFGLLAAPDLLVEPAGKRRTAGSQGLQGKLFGGKVAHGAHGNGIAPAFGRHGRKGMGRAFSRGEEGRPGPAEGPHAHPGRKAAACRLLLKLDHGRRVGGHFAGLDLAAQGNAGVLQRQIQHALDGALGKLYALADGVDHPALAQGELEVGQDAVPAQEDGLGALDVGGRAVEAVEGQPAGGAVACQPELQGAPLHLQRLETRLPVVVDAAKAFQRLAAVFQAQDQGRVGPAPARLGAGEHAPVARRHPAFALLLAQALERGWPRAVPAPVAERLLPGLDQAEVPRGNPDQAPRDRPVLRPAVLAAQGLFKPGKPHLPDGLRLDEIGKVQQAGGLRSGGEGPALLRAKGPGEERACDALHGGEAFEAGVPGLQRKDEGRLGRIQHAEALKRAVVEHGGKPVLLQRLEAEEDEAALGLLALAQAVQRPHGLEAVPAVPELGHARRGPALGVFQRKAQASEIVLAPEEEGGQLPGKKGQARQAAEEPRIVPAVDLLRPLEVGKAGRIPVQEPFKAPEAVGLPVGLGLGQPGELGFGLLPAAGPEVDGGPGHGMEGLDGGHAPFGEASADPAEHGAGGARKEEALHGVVGGHLLHQPLALLEPGAGGRGQPEVDAALQQRRLEAVELAKEGVVVGVHGRRLGQAEPLRIGAQRLVLGTDGLEEPCRVGILHRLAAELEAQLRTHAAPGVAALVDGA